MQTNGLKVDTAAIAEGLYRIICDKGEEAVVAFGMIPKWIMDCLEKMLREKVLSIIAEQKGMTVSEAKLYVTEERLYEICRPIEKAVASGIYAAASNAERMVV